MAGRSADPERQAVRAVRMLDGIGTPRHGRDSDDKIHSYGSARQYQQVFKTAATWCNEQFGVRLYHLTVAQAQRYLDARSNDIGQTQLNNERRALETFLRAARKDPSLVVKHVVSEVPKIEQARAYTDAQIALMAKYQTDRLSLSMRVADAAGLRAAELFTLRRFSERSPSSHRAWSQRCFRGHGDWSRYTVVGKGGLMREVRLPPALASELEARRRETPVQVTDRGIKIRSHYDLIGGQSFSTLFSRMANNVLGKSRGAHGLRHSYAQRRLQELLHREHQPYREALAIISQELGHFRPEITEVYLR